MVPTLLLVGSVGLYRVLGVIVPCGLKLSCAASVPTSCTPELVKTVTWLRSLTTVLMSIRLDNWVMY